MIKNLENNPLELLKRRFEDCAWGKAKHGKAELKYFKIFRWLGYLTIIVSLCGGLIASIMISFDLSERAILLLNITAIFISSLLVIVESLDKFSRYNYKSKAENHKAAKEGFRKLQKDIELYLAVSDEAKLKKQVKHITEQYNQIEAKYPSADKFYSPNMENEIKSSNTYTF